MFILGTISIFVDRRAEVPGIVIFEFFNGLVRGTNGVSRRDKSLVLVVVVIGSTSQRIGDRIDLARREIRIAGDDVVRFAALRIRLPDDTGHGT